MINIEDEIIIPYNKKLICFHYTVYNVDYTQFLNVGNNSMYFPDFFHGYHYTDRDITRIPRSYDSESIVRYTSNEICKMIIEKYYPNAYYIDANKFSSIKHSNTTSKYRIYDLEYSTIFLIRLITTD